MDRYFKIGHRFHVAGIDGEYEVKEISGKGASCIVYQTTFTNRDGVVTEHLLKEYNPAHLAISRNENGCLRVPDEERPAFEGGKKRFEAGYRLQLNMRQKMREVTNSISNIQNIFFDFGTIYIDMTLFCGEVYSHVRENSLFDLLRRTKAITQVISRYHKAGFLHLDIKPDNIFTIPETCELVIFFDFDSVIEKNQVLKSGVLSYTQNWAAPEQTNLMRKKNICEATDLYAVGEIVFWQIFGRHSVDEEHWTFCAYEFNTDAPIFQNVNPKVFPLLAEFFHKTICISVKERYQSGNQLIEKLDQLIALADPKESYLVSGSLMPNAFFIGRDRELVEIHEKLKNISKLFLSGIGGIGKSELAKNYANIYKDNYDTILFVTYNGSWKMMVNDDSKIQITNFERYEGEKEADYCNRKLRKLSELCDERTLLIIDNLNEDEFSKEELKTWESILGLNCKLIFITRIEDWNYSCVKVSALEQRQSLIDLYQHYCNVNEDQQSVVNEMIEYVDGHTLTVELIAKLVTASRFSSEMALEKLKGYDILQSGKEKVVLDKDNIRKRRTPFDHICTIFDMTQLSRPQLYIMANMALVPPDGIEAVRLEEWCELESFDVVNRLVVEGWIYRVGNIMKMHPVIAEVTLVSCTKINFDYCKAMLKNQAKYLEACNLKNYQAYERTYQDVVFFNALAENLIRSKMHADAVADILTGVSRLISGFGYIDQAIKYQQYSFELLTQSNRKHNEEAAKALNNLSLLYDSLGDFKLALQYSKTALRAKKKPLWFLRSITAGPVATSYNSLATIYYHMSQYGKALQCAHKALVIQERFLGMEDIETVTSLSNLAVIYRETGNVKEAFRYGEKALSKKINAFGEDHISTAASFSNLSALYHDMGDLEQALRYAKKALEIEKKHWGEKHSSIAITFSNLSALYYEMGDYGQAVQYSQKSLEIRTELLGKDNVALSTSLCSLGTLYGELGDWELALQYTQQALCIETAAFGEIHPKIVITLNNIAGIYDDMGDFKQALQTYDRALHMAQTMFGSKHNLISVCLSNIGYLYEKAGDLKKAEEYYAQAYEVKRVIFGDGHPGTKRIKQRWMSVKNGQQSTEK